MNQTLCAFFGVLFASLSSGWATTTVDCWPQLEISVRSLSRIQRSISSSRIEPAVSNLSITSSTFYHWAIAAVSLIIIIIIECFNSSSRSVSPTITTFVFVTKRLRFKLRFAKPGAVSPWVGSDSKEIHNDLLPWRNDSSIWNPRQYLSLKKIRFS